MFTGLIAATGTVLKPAEENTSRISIELTEKLAGQLSEGSSIAVNGCCLTALDIARNAFSADLAEETRARTTLARLPAGTVVNLEMPTPAGAPLAGHIVQGHVDGIGRVLTLDEKPGGDWDLRISVPKEVADAVLPQGSIAIDGISLTIAEMQQAGEEVHLRVAIIPHTYQVTNLRTLHAGSEVNIETDILAKYAKRRAESAPSNITLGYLIANGY
jgi:riboflavin synthase